MMDPSEIPATDLERLANDATAAALSLIDDMDCLLASEADNYRTKNVAFFAAVALLLEGVLAHATQALPAHEAVHLSPTVEDEGLVRVDLTFRWTTPLKSFLSFRFHDAESLSACSPLSSETPQVPGTQC